MKTAIPLPDIVEAVFLAGNGFVGYRCECGFVVTGRTSCAIDQAMNDHNRFRHLDESVQGMEETETAA